MDANNFIYFSDADLQVLKVQCMACLTDNFQAHQSYSIAGRTITRANVAQVGEMLEKINFAIAYNAGNISRVTVADFR